MNKQRLHLYTLDMKYVRDLSHVDDRVLSVSPQTGKERRPFIGIVVICGDKKYCVPLSSPKPKHAGMKNDRDFSKINDQSGKLIGVLNFNNMIPVNHDVIRPLDLIVRPHDTAQQKAYKGLLNDELDWCNAHRTAIESKANKLYAMIRDSKGSHALQRRCCDFQKLEAVLQKYTF